MTRRVFVKTFPFHNFPMYLQYRLQNGGHSVQVKRLIVQHILVQVNIVGVFDMKIPPEVIKPQMSHKKYAYCVFISYDVTINTYWHRWMNSNCLHLNALIVSTSYQWDAHLWRHWLDYDVKCSYHRTPKLSSNGNIFRVPGSLCGEITGHRWIPLTKASDAELWCFLWSARE